MKRFSLILCTINREKVVREFFDSLSKQKDPPSFEVILVDQNSDGRLLPIIQEFQSVFPIRHYKSEPGLSHARNYGLQFAEGEIIAFPDDDCTYPETLLRSVSEALKNEKVDGISTLVTDQHGRFSGSFMYHTARRISHQNVWRCGVSISIFVKRSAADGILFDETLGTGSGTVYGSGEETDFLLNLIRSGKHLDFHPELVVNHPVFIGPWTLKRGYLYGNGMGRVLHKHRYSIFRTLYFASLQLVRACGAFLTLNFPRMMFHLAMSWGRISGYVRSIFQKEKRVGRK